MSKKYSIVRTDTASAGLKNIISNIKEKFGAKIASEKFDRIEKSILLLEDSPYIGSFPNYAALRRVNFRVLIVERTIIFYKVDDKKKIVTIYVIADQREDYIKIIKEL